MPARLHLKTLPHLAANVRAFGPFSATDLPETKAAQAPTINAVIDQVAARRGNTRAVCPQSYIHPAVPGTWQKGELRRSSRRTPVEGLDEDEVQTAGFLRKLTRHQD